MVLKKGISIYQVLAISIAVTLISSISIFLFMDVKLKQQTQDFEDKLIFVNTNIISSLNKMNEDITKELSSVNENLSLEIEFIGQSLEIFKQKNKQEIIALEQLTVQIESQSNIKLDELREDLSTIKVKSSDFSSIVDDVIVSVVSVGTNKGQGSGAIIDGRGFIVTNYHVIEDASIIRAMTFEEGVHDAELIAINQDLDLALLKIDAGNLEALKFGDSDDVLTGEKVIALGNPIGLSFTVTEGIVSAIHRIGPNNQEIYTQTDVPINPGNSGGPLINAKSRIIGINNFKIGGFEGLGFAIESNVVEEFVDSSIAAWEEAQE